MYYRVLVGSQRYHGTEALTYSSDDKLDPGQIVRVMLGKTPVLGILYEPTDQPSFATKPILQWWKDVVVPKTTLLLMKWLYDYYPAPLGSVTELFTPPALPKMLAEAPGTTNVMKPHTSILPPLTSQQSEAIHTIATSEYRSVLLHGDTGTGKTRLYLELTLQQIEQGKSVILTTPEIGLTKPLVEILTRVFGKRVIVTHSGMTAASRRKQWLRVCTSALPVIVVGPRSALFYPVKNVGLIIVDEAHDSAYKQDQAPHYQATRIAAKLRELHNATLVLGTATPLISDYYAFTAKGLPVIRLTKAAVSSSATVDQQVIDARERSNFTRSAYLSNHLLDGISQALAKQEQSLLFLNRRGSARVVMCQNCGWRALCPHCDTLLTFHADTHNMRCHGCDFKDSVPISCPACKAPDILFKSIGTKALEAELIRHFPSAKIARFDGDTHHSESLDARFSDLHSGTIDILIGTQVIAKGFDLPKLSIVGIVQADVSLSIPDYTAAERTYQLLSQVSGRIGRGHRNGTLILQTYRPDSSIISCALSKNYNDFYKQELQERKTYRFPPFTHLMTVTCNRTSSKSAEAACLKAKQLLYSNVAGIAIDGPSPRFIEKVADKYAWHLIVRAKSRTKLLEAIKHLPANCIPNLDPTTLL